MVIFSRVLIIAGVFAFLLGGASLDSEQVMIPALITIGGIVLMGLGAFIRSRYALFTKD